MIQRNILKELKGSRKSILLLGPRQTGKSTLIVSLRPDLTINLADQESYFQYASRPSELREQIETSKAKTIFIDEVQKLPGILNTVQALIDEKRSLKFYLTGSSARKLRRGQANLLPGRVLNFQLGPLVSSELNYKANQEDLLRYGSLPEVYLESKASVKTHLLKSYFTNYLQEEIRAEAIVRSVDVFARALPVSFQTAGQFVDYSKLSKLAKVSRHNLSRFFEIFEDTLVGFRCWPDSKLLEKADLVKHPKFYPFDLGVYNVLAGGFEVTHERKGRLFEILIANQLQYSAWSKCRDLVISTFRTRGGLEADFILTLDRKRFAVEVKATTEVFDDAVGALKSVRQKYEPRIETFVAHMGTRSKKVEGVWCLPWQQLLEELSL